MHRFALRLAFAVTTALFAVGFLAVPAGAADRTVRIVSSDYAPDPVRITVGDRVTWLNGDSLPHDASGNGWSTPLLMNGERASVRFTARGTYRYTCTIHPAMSGRVIVSAAGGSGATTPPTDPAPRSSAAARPAAPVAILLVAATAFGFGLVLRRTARRPR
ncbi:MAG: plastocyanin/azurin family copper-binding protein [Chloroflexota bacterium]